ncbi:MAG: cytochrome c3 family protein [Candidatus Kapaibacteriota bacterium]|jgi:hypothetical protein
MNLAKTKYIAFCLIFCLLLVNAFLLINYLRSGKNFTTKQNVSFSHKMHSKYNISCLFCHYNAETDSYANLPTTKDCMICHIALRTESELLKSVVFSYDSSSSLVYKKNYDLPDYVRFSHALHINSGIDCATCHGFVDQMDSTYQVRNLTMGFCINCHKSPMDYYIKPRDISGIFTLSDSLFQTDTIVSPAVNLFQPIKVRKIKQASTECSTCHN